MKRSLHPAWVVAMVACLVLLGAAGFRATPGVLINPLHQEFGWSHGTIGLAMTVNMTLFGLCSPFAASLMERFGMRPVVVFALTMIAAGSAFSVSMTQSWQLILYWGVFVGLGTGSMSMAFVATVTARWFVARRGLVSGVLRPRPQLCRSGPVGARVGASGGADQGASEVRAARRRAEATASRAGVRSAHCCQ